MSSEHIVKSFDEQLRRLENLIAEMGGLAEAQLADAIDAMSYRDLDKAARIIADDQRIDDLELLVDQEAIAMLALRQPMARDLREIVGALKAASMLERIGDYAKNVAKRTAALVETPPVPSAQTVVRLGMLAQEMIKDVLDAYIARDAEKADQVRQRDQELDALHTSIFRELLTYMMEDPRNITACTHLLFVAKNIERIGDHATNIAEVVIFMVQRAHARRSAAEGRRHQLYRAAGLRKADVQLAQAWTLAKPRVLIVEDEDAQAEMLRYNFDREGFDVSVALDGEEAILAVQEHQPDLVLLDLMLPGTSGIAVCQRLRSRPETRALPIIMLTARGEEATAFAGSNPAPTTMSSSRSRRASWSPGFAPSCGGRARRSVRSGSSAATSSWIWRRIASPAAANGSISAPPSSACCACSWSALTGCSRASSCSTGPGGGTSTSNCAPSTCTSAGFARRWARTATTT